MPSMKMFKYKKNNTAQRMQNIQAQNEEANLANEAKKDIVLDNAIVEGADTLAGTGYSSFRTLLDAKNKKVQDLKEKASKKQISNFASLLGGFGRLG